MSLELINPGIRLNFIGNRYLAFAISGLVIAICLGSIVFKGGLKMGIDFAGGLLMQVQFGQEVNADQIRETFAGSNLPSINIQTFGEEGQNEFLLNLQTASSGDVDRGLSNQMTAALEQHFGQKATIRRVEMVGPKVGQDLRQKALYALYYSVLMILIYISGRFEKKWGTSAIFVAALLGVVYAASLFQVSVNYLIILALVVTMLLCYRFKFEYALGAILALVHDVIVTVGIFSLLDKEITLSFVAAILTIIGYSLNDTIIIFDRIRENVRKDRSSKTSYMETINRSINETLSRTILTSGTTILVLICLYFFGGPVNQDFALALLIGIVAGTFSSIFISAPVLLFWTRNKA